MYALTIYVYIYHIPILSFNIAEEWKYINHKKLKIR
jgi:hypothetical protein